MKLWLRLSLALAIGIVSAILGATSFVQEAEMRLSDQWLRLQGRAAPPPGFVVVALDETSYRELNIPFDKPWPRERHAQLIQRLKQLGAKRVVFDVLFMGSGSDAEGDAKLTQAFAALDSVIGVELSSRFVGAQGGGYVVEDLEQPYEPFRAVTTQALVNLTPLNGAIRNFPFGTSELAQRFPFLAQAAVAGRASTQERSPDQRDLIRYYGPARTFPIYSVWELLDEKMPVEESRFKNATVFVGLLLRSGTGGAQKDSYLSPFGGSMIFGVEVHATIAANLASQSWIRRPGAATEALIQGAIGSLGALAALSFPPVIVASVLGGLAVTWIVASYLLLSSGTFVSGAFVVLGLLPLLLLAKALTAYAVTRRSEQTLRSAISLYVSPDVVPKLEKDGASLSLGGEKVWVTALFTDIVDFTRITEEMPAEKTTEMLNAYFTEVMDVVFQNEGTLLKFIGDAVFALWGAPIKVVNHAERAVTTAKAIAREVERFNATGRFPALHTRIGVHTGPMLVGNLGSAKRFDYTAIGDSVNLASRVEGLNKYFGTTILFTESTRRDAGGLPGSTFMGSVQVKGRREAVALYSTFEPPLSSDIEQRWAAALKSFKAARFEEASTALNALSRDEVRLTTAAHLYLEECAKYAGRSAPMGWDGEIYFDSK